MTRAADRPEPDREGVVWVDDRLVESAAAQVSVFDHGFTVGDGVFDTLKVIRGVPFALSRHLARLDRGARAIGIEPPDAEALRAAAAAVVEANGVVDGRLRITLTSGVGPLGPLRGTDHPTLVVALSPLPARAPTADVCTVEWTRNERGALSGIKATAFGENVMALTTAHARGADEAIFANTSGNLCEGAGSNVFVVVDGRLVTPPLSAGPLPGVTRELVLELSEATEADLPLDALGAAGEAFLTSSTREVQPIRAVDGRLLGAAPGPVTRAVADAYAALVARDLDP